MDKRIYLIGFIFLMIPLASALTPPTGGVSYYDYSSVTDLWGSNDFVNNGASSILTYPVFSISGSSSPDSYYFDGNDYLNRSNFVNTENFSVSIWFNTTYNTGISYLYDNKISDSVGDGFWLRAEPISDRLRFAHYEDDVAKNILIISCVSACADGNWHNIVITTTSGDAKAYLDGISVHNLTGTYTETISDGNIYVGSNSIGTDKYIGNLDEVKFYNDTINSSEVYTIWEYGNIGRNTTYSNFTVKVNDYWDNSNVNNITVIVNGTTYTNTTGNTITTNILSNDTNNYTIEVVSESHINRNFSDIPVSSNYNAVLYGSDIKFKAYEKFTGNELSANFTIETTTKENDESFYLNNKSYNVTASKLNYFPITEEKTITNKLNTTLNISDLYNTNITIIPRDVFSNTSLSGLNITLSYGSWSETYTNVSNASFQIVNTLSYTLEIDSESYNMSSTTLSGFATGNTSEIVYLYKYNSAFFTFYDEENSLLTQAVNTTLESGYNTYNFTNSNGTYYLQYIATGNYDLTSITAGYNDVSLYVTMAQNSYREVDVHFNNLTLTNKTFVVYDEGRDAVGGVVVSFTRLINGSVIVVEQGTTDFSGSVRVQLNENTKYGIVASKEGYNTFTGEVKPIEDSYVISIQSDSINRFTSTYDDIHYNTDVQYTYNNTYADVSLEIYSAEGYLTYYGFNFTYRGVDYFKNITGIPAGGNVMGNITNVDVTDEQKVYITFFFKSVNQTLISWDENFYLVDVVPTDNTLKTGLLDTTGMTETQLAIVGGIILLLLVTLAAGLSKSYLVTGVVSIAVIGLLWSKGFFLRELSIVTMIVIALLTIAKLVKGGSS